MKLILEIEVKNRAEAYQATTRLSGDFNVQSASVDGENWIFDDKNQVKYFLKDKYLNQETRQEVDIKASLITKKII